MGREQARVYYISLHMRDKWLIIIIIIIIIIALAKEQYVDIST
jgi:hypothetical protein